MKKERKRGMDKKEAKMGNMRHQVKLNHNFIRGKNFKLYRKYIVDNHNSPCIEVGGIPVNIA